MHTATLATSVGSRHGSPATPGDNAGRRPEEEPGFYTGSESGHVGPYRHT
jgi:hypothetical protein